MPTDLFEDALDLQIGLLEAENPSPGGDEAHRRSYPYPLLRPTGQQETRTFRSIVLENPYLRATVGPGLGGRVLGLLDKRSDTEILPRPAALLPQAGSRRGAALREGLQLRLDGEDRPNALGSTDILLDEAPDEDFPGGVWIAESAGGTGISFHLHLSLPPDRAELLIEVRAFNRTFDPILYNGALAIHLGDGRALRLLEGVAFYSPARDAGLALFPGSVPLDGASFEDGTLLLARFDGLQPLSPRQLDTWTVRLVPLSALGDLHAASPEVTAYLDDAVLRVQATETRPGHKLLLLTGDGQTLESPADLHPEHPLEIPLDGLPARPTALVVQDAGRKELLRLDRSDPGVRALGRLGVGEGTSSNASTSQRLNALSNPDLQRAAFDPAFRSAAHTLLGTRAMARREFDAAGAAFETALLFNAEDHLAWWSKAVAHRLAGEEAEERPELLNAHYLAPLEPALRAESFLSQPMAMTKDPSPLLRPLEDTPESFVEVAALLVEMGLFDQANRWIDEALRHTDLAILRYLQAYCYLTASRMEAEAAEQLVAAARQPVGPPFPWRRVEVVALRALVERFPADARLKGTFQLAERFARR